MSNILEMLSSHLNEDQVQAISQKIGASGGSFIGKMLDQDGDGDFDVSDMMKMGMSQLFGRKQTK